MALPPDNVAAARARLDAAAELIDGSSIAPALPDQVRRRAREQARTLIDTGAGAGDAAGADAAVAAATAELLAAVAVEMAAHPAQAADLLLAISDEARIAPLALARELLSNGRLLELGVDVAADVQLAMLAALTRAESSREAVTAALQRRLARLRFDLHDGPQQDVHLLAQDLSLFREQLRPIVSDDPDHDRLMGRLDDLEAQLVALDGDLRRLSTSVQSPFLASGTLHDALSEIALAFAQRTGIEPQARFTGELPSLTESQQITVLALVREALSNVRKHSDATRVTITVAAGDAGISVEVSDDGGGFDTETTIVRAARSGHLGLVGMRERVRMLGGRTQIDSRPGGPTVISAFLPPFTPGEG